MAWDSTCHWTHWTRWARMTERRQPASCIMTISPYSTPGDESGPFLMGTSMEIFHWQLRGYPFKSSEGHMDAGMFFQTSTRFFTLSWTRISSRFQSLPFTRLLSDMCVSENEAYPKNDDFHKEQMMITRQMRNNCHISRKKTTLKRLFSLHAGTVDAQRDNVL